MIVDGFGWLRGCFLWVFLGLVECGGLVFDDILCYLKGGKEKGFFEEFFRVRSIV